MGTHSERRSSLDEAVAVVAALEVGQGTPGGRRAASPPPEEGGGYLDSCTPVWSPIGGSRGDELRRRQPVATDELTLDDLRRCGLDERWLRVARRIGVAAFLEAWQELDRDNEGVSAQEREQVRVRVPLLARLRRYRRNRWILALAATGLGPAEIRHQVRDPDQAGDLCEEMSHRHILRIVARG